MQAQRRAARALFRRLDASARLFRHDAWRAPPYTRISPELEQPAEEWSSPDAPPTQQLPPIPPLRLLATSGDLAFFHKPAGM